MPFDLPAFDESGDLNVVVEAPRGSRIKFVYKPDSSVFLAERLLPIGLAYPYDWGFICGTCADDGDPVDALVIADVATYPGTLVKCRPLALLEMTQIVEGHEEANPRVIAMPSWNETAAGMLTDSVKAQLERFFLEAVSLTGKQVSVKGWASAGDATKHIRARVT